MKNILAPTDFSATANSAVEYACSLATAANATVTLFNCFHIPVIASDGPVITIPFEELEKASTASLVSRKNELEKKFAGLQIKIECKAGFAGEEIVEYTQTHKFDLVVMGITGSGDFDRLLGSTATVVSKRSETPVIIVPPKYGIKKPENIVVAFDFRAIKNTKSVNIVIDLAKTFKSKITALNIRQGTEEASIERSLSASQAGDLISDVPHRMVNYTDSDTIEGLEHYLKSHDVDLLVMLKRKHSFFDQLLHGSHTRKMAFHTHIPLLVLHE